MAEVADKWGNAVTARGFAQIPNDLMHVNALLAAGNKLTAIELLVLLQLATGWWRRDDRPFPAMATLAKHCGVSERQIQRTVANLEDRGLLKRIGRRRRGMIASNAYNLDPLATMLTQLVRELPNEFPRKIQGAAIRQGRRRRG